MNTSPHPSRGDVILVDFPFSSGAGFKRRPALVVQNDRDNARLANTIIAMITSQTARVAEATQLHINITTTDGQNTGLRQDSAVICTNVFTIEKRLVLQRIGVLSARLMSEIDACLKAALKLP